MICREQVRLQQHGICRQRRVSIFERAEHQIPGGLAQRKVAILVAFKFSRNFDDIGPTLTFNLTTDFSPAFIRRATSSSVRCRHALSYVSLDPMRASFSRVCASRSGVQKQ